MRASGQTRIDAQNPWPGLESFDEAAERFFNGRREETAELRRLVLQEPLTVLFGMSGLGKTSLLQAGLFPAIRKDNVLPVYVRLDVRNRDGPLIDQVARALQLELRRHQVDAPPFEAGESLWSYLHRAGLELWSAQNQLLTPLFVLDQFEEVFTHGADRAEAVAQLRRDLSDLVENRVPAPLAELIRGTDSAGARFFLDGQRYKVLLSFREDFLPPVEGWKLEMPSILRNRLRLLPMSAARAFEAVHDTAPHLVGEALAHQIVAFVAAAQDRGTAGASLDGPGELKVEPALLSLVCHGLNEKRKERGQDAFDDALLREAGPSIIADFYARSVKDLPETAQRFIEEQLITESGFRKQCAVDDARHRHGVTDADLTLLVDRRLLRIEPLRGTDHVELVHDLLTGVVREAREWSRRRARYAQRRRRRIKQLGIGLVGLAGLTTMLVASERSRHARLEREATRLVDSLRLETQARYADSMRTMNDSLRTVGDTLARKKAVAESLRTVAELRAQQERASRIELDTILKLGTAARVAEARLEEFLRARDDRAQRLAAVPESLRARGREQALADSVRADSSPLANSTLANLRSNDSAAGGWAMRGGARAATYLATARFIPFDSYSRSDLFDLSHQGVVLVAADTMPLMPTARALFGDSLPTNPEREQQPAFFRDGRRAGHQHWVEWEAAAGVGSIAVYAAHDGRRGAVPSNSPGRSFRRLTFTTRDRSGAVLDTLVDYLPALPYAGLEAFGDDQPLRSLSACFPTRARARGAGRAPPGRARYRLELVQAAQYGPRVIEVDGYADASCGAPDRAIGGLGTSLRPSELAAFHGSSTVTVGLVLEMAEGKNTGREQVAGAIEFLARTSPAAWNQALVLRAGALLRAHAPAGGSAALWTDSLTRVLTRIVPGWRNRVAIIVARERVAREGSRVLLDSTLSDARVRDSLLAIAGHLGAPPDSVEDLQRWLTNLDSLEARGRRAEQLAANPDRLLSERRDALNSLLQERSRSVRRGRGTDGTAVRLRLDALADRLVGTWAICSYPVGCPAPRRQPFFEVSDSLYAMFTPGPGNADTSVTLVLLRDSLQVLRAPKRVPLAVPAGLGPPPLGPTTVLREQGHWTLRVYDAMGRLVLRHAFSVGDAGGSIAPGQEVRGVLTDQSPVFNGRPVEFYRLRCTAGQTIRVNVTSQHDNVALVVAPGGNQVAFNDDAVGTNALLDWTCPDNRVYAIGAGAFSPAATGPFVLSVRAAAGPASPPPLPLTGAVVGSIRLGQPVSGSVSAQSPLFNGRPVAFYRFQCRAGQAIRVNVTSQHDNVAIIAEPGGNQVAFNDDANGTNAQLDWACPDNRVYLVGAGGYTVATVGTFVLRVDAGGER